MTHLLDVIYGFITILGFLFPIHPFLILFPFPIHLLTTLSHKQQTLEQKTLNCTACLYPALHCLLLPVEILPHT